MTVGNFLIIKIGTQTLIDDTGKIRDELIAGLLVEIKKQLAQGKKILIVSSGAVATGRFIVSNKKLDRNVAASVGQPELFSHFLDSARKLNIKVAEILLSRPHIVRRQQFLHLQEKIQAIFEIGNIVPIVNENDFLVSDTDWSFGDNDSLAATLAIALKADKLIILSHVEGLFTANPDKDEKAKLVSKVEDVNAELMKFCSSDISDAGRGGMISKLKSARLCTAVGIATQIINGQNSEQVGKALRNEESGTVFLPRNTKGGIRERDRWILSAKNSAASIEIDDGAEKALRAGKSLLAVGIKKIYGEFEIGEIVEIVNKKKEGVAFGLVDIGSKILSSRSFGVQKGVQVTHADNIMAF
jgi:glutamate 5-kinase